MSESQARDVIATCLNGAEKVECGSDICVAIDKNVILSAIMNRSKILNVELFHETRDALAGNLKACLDKYGILRRDSINYRLPYSQQRDDGTLKDQILSSLFVNNQNADMVIDGVSVVISSRNDPNRYMSDYGYQSISYSPIGNPDIDFVFLKVGTRFVDVNLYAAYLPTQKHYIPGSRLVRSYTNTFDKPLGSIICGSPIISTTSDLEFGKAYRDGIPKRFLIVEAYYVIKYNEHKSIEPECLVPPEWMIIRE